MVHDDLQERIQTVVFVRHGVAKHNFQGADLKSPTLHDPPLVHAGKVGALRVGQQIQAWFGRHPSRALELVIASPLTRCLQTALLAFLPGETYHEQQQHQQSPPLTIACVEEVREAYGMHYPDKRRSKSLLQTHWPMILFDSQMTEEDTRWTAHTRESLHDLETRIAHFLERLIQRSEESIVVVTHGVWMETLFQKYHPTTLAGNRRVYNCNAFATQCVSKNSSFERMQNVLLIE